METVYDFPTSADLREIEQELIPAAEEDDPIFDEFPIEESDFDRVMWEQEDNYAGLQQVRGLEGEPRVVQRPGSKMFDMEPGVYGEFTGIREKELTQRRKFATFGDPINIDDLVGKSQMFLLSRRYDRIRYIIWTLLTSGVFSVPRADGTILHADSFPLKTLAASVPWTTYATATPYADIQAAQLLSFGQSVDFGGGATLWMNRVTANALLRNANAADGFGRRGASGATFNSLDDWNRWLQSNDLPSIRIYDRFYLDDAKNPQRFIPNGKAILIGKRTNGAKLGAYLMTRNANNPRLEPGPYTRVIDHGETRIPRKIEVHDGHNGGPAIFYPGAIVVITVF
jgi:hypothetical protein